jgi:hypothetical protein
LAPLGDAVFDVTGHIVMNDFGRLGIAYVETDAAEGDRATIIENILTRQYSYPLRVVALNTHEGWSRDVTEDIAREVLSRSESRGLRQRCCAKTTLPRKHARLLQLYPLLHCRHIMCAADSYGCERREIRFLA